MKKNYLTLAGILFCMTCSFLQAQPAQRSLPHHAPSMAQTEEINQQGSGLRLFEAQLMMHKLLEVQLFSAFVDLAVFDVYGQRIEQEVLVDLQENTVYVDLFTYSGFVTVEAVDMLHDNTHSESFYLQNPLPKHQKWLDAQGRNDSSR